MFANIIMCCLSDVVVSEDYERSGRPSASADDSRVNKINTLVREIDAGLSESLLMRSACQLDHVTRC